MRLTRVSFPELPAPFFAIELKNKLLRVREAAAVFEIDENERPLIADPHAYLQNLPRSEKVLRALLKMISGKPRTLAKPAADGFPYLLPIEDAIWHPPIERPGKILCIGLNYRDHCEEQNKPIPKKPLVFPKFATSLVGHGQAITLPKKLDKCIDYEAEFGVVIGKKASRVTKRAAMKHVGGYTMINDLSARTLQNEERQWSRAKGFDGSCPCGPAIVTPDEIPDPHALAIELRLNGEVMQQSSTSNLIFDVPALISFISAAITLEPGDIISTGTPGGVGVYREPQVFLGEGDQVEVKIERLGVLKNEVARG